MSEQFRDFDAEFPIETVPVLRLKLGGQEFSTMDRLHPRVFMTDKTGIDRIVEFLRRTLDVESRERFELLLDDPESLISDEMLDAAAAWIIRQLSGAGNRPTSPSSPSGTGQTPTGPTSEANSTSPEPVST